MSRYTVRRQETTRKEKARLLLYELEHGPIFILGFPNHHNDPRVIQASREATDDYQQWAKRQGIIKAVKELVPELRREQEILEDR